MHLVPNYYSLHAQFPLYGMRPFINDVIRRGGGVQSPIHCYRENMTKGGRGGSKNAAVTELLYLLPLLQDLLIRSCGENQMKSGNNISMSPVGFSTANNDIVIL